MRTEIENKNRTIVHFTCQEREKKGKKRNMDDNTHAVYMVRTLPPRWYATYVNNFFIKKFKKQHENIKMPLIIHVNQCESKKKKKNLQVQTLFLVFSNYKQKLYSICMNCFYSVSFLFFNSE
jgi:hypothetical protein